MDTAELKLEFIRNLKIGQVFEFSGHFPSRHQVFCFKREDIEKHTTDLSSECIVCLDMKTGLYINFPIHGTLFYDHITLH
jgi:hypothetical protein